MGREYNMPPLFYYRWGDQYLVVVPSAPAQAGWRVVENTDSAMLFASVTR